MILALRWRKYFPRRHPWGIKNCVLGRIFQYFACAEWIPKVETCNPMYSSGEELLNDNLVLTGTSQGLPVRWPRRIWCRQIYIYLLTSCCFWLAKYFTGKKGENHFYSRGLYLSNFYLHTAHTLTWHFNLEINQFTSSCHLNRIADE